MTSTVGEPPSVSPSSTTLPFSGDFKHEWRATDRHSADNSPLDTGGLVGVLLLGAALLHLIGLSESYTSTTVGNTTVYDLSTAL